MLDNTQILFVLYNFLFLNTINDFIPILVGIPQ